MGGTIRRLCCLVPLQTVSSPLMEDKLMVSYAQDPQTHGHVNVPLFCCIPRQALYPENHISHHHRANAAQITITRQLQRGAQFFRTTSRLACHNTALLYKDRGHMPGPAGCLLAAFKPAQRPHSGRQKSGKQLSVTGFTPCSWGTCSDQLYQSPRQSVGAPGRGTLFRCLKSGFALSRTNPRIFIFSRRRDPARVLPMTVVAVLAHSIGTEYENREKSTESAPARRKIKRTVMPKVGKRGNRCGSTAKGPTANSSPILKVLTSINKRDVNHTSYETPPTAKPITSSSTPSRCEDLSGPQPPFQAHD
jgi:hypothetical protein